MDIESISESPVLRGEPIQRVVSWEEAVLSSELSQLEEHPASVHELELDRVHLDRVVKSKNGKRCAKFKPLVLEE